MRIASCLAISSIFTIPVVQSGTAPAFRNTNSSIIAQSRETTPPVSTAFAVLTTPVDSKSVSVGHEVILRSLSDIVFKGEMLVPRGSRFVGHVQATRTKGKDVPQSLVAVIIDKAITVDGSEIPVQGIIAAVAAPQDTSLTSDPAYGMMHSNEPKMVGPGNARTTGVLPPSSKANSSAAVATAELKGRMEGPLLLDENSQGVSGYEGLSISWQLTTPPPVTVFANKNKSVKLDPGTQVLLRMATPRVVR